MPPTELLRVVFGFVAVLGMIGVCDDAEYLVILGPAGETLITGGIEAPSIENAGTVAPAEAPIAGLAALADKLRAANILPRGNKDAA